MPGWPLDQLRSRLARSVLDRVAGGVEWVHLVAFLHATTFGSVRRYVTDMAITGVAPGVLAAPRSVDQG